MLSLYRNFVLFCFVLLTWSVWFIDELYEVLQSLEIIHEHLCVCALALGIHSFNQNLTEGL